MIIDGVEMVVEHASGCSCEPTEADARRVLERHPKSYCIHCENVMDPQQLRLVCFCRADSELMPDWAGNVTEYKGAVTLVINNDHHLLHEPCSRKALPTLYS